MFMLAACSSKADEPQEDYNLMHLLGVDATQSFFWTGKATQAQCQDDNFGSSCAVLKAADDQYPDDNIQLFFSNPISQVGTVTMIVAHPNTALPTSFTFNVTGDATLGYEFKDGEWTRLMKLTASPALATSADGTQALFAILQADIRQDGLMGTVTLLFPGSASVTGVSYAINLKSELKL